MNSKIFESKSKKIKKKLVVAISYSHLAQANACSWSKNVTAVLNKFQVTKKKLVNLFLIIINEKFS